MRQTRDLESENDVDVPERDFGGHTGKAATMCGAGPESLRSSSTALTCCSLQPRAIAR